MSNQISILNTSIRQYENLYSLNDLHLASGNDPKHRPSLFVRNEQIKELVKEIENERSTKTIFALKTIRGGADITKQGTWACEELVLSYAIWISPKFHLVVLRAFLAMRKQQVQQQLALPEPEPKRERKVMLEMTEEEACDFCWLWFSHKMQNRLLNELIEPLQAIKSEFHSQVYSHSFEYKAFYRAMFEIVDSLAETFKDSADSNWVRIREHIIEYRLNQRPILFSSRLKF